jgi:hypothetical protein
MKSSFIMSLPLMVYAGTAYHQHQNTHCVGAHLLSATTYGAPIDKVAECQALCEAMPGCKGFEAKIGGRCSYFMAEIDGYKADLSASVNCFHKNLDGFDVNKDTQCAGSTDLKQWKLTGSTDDCTKDDDSVNGINKFAEFLDDTFVTNGDLTDQTKDQEQGEAELAKCAQVCKAKPDCAGFEALKVFQKTSPATRPKVTKCSFWKFGAKTIKAGKNKPGVDCHIKTDSNRGKCAHAGSTDL